VPLWRDAGTLADLTDWFERRLQHGAQVARKMLADGWPSKPEPSVLVMEVSDLGASPCS